MLLLQPAVNGKLMQRSVSAALHGFAVNDGNWECRFETILMPYLFCPRHPGTMQADFWLKAPSRPSKGLADYNPRSTGLSDV